MIDCIAVPAYFEFVYKVASIISVKEREREKKSSVEGLLALPDSLLVSVISFDCQLAFRNANGEKQSIHSNHRPECRDTSGTFTPFLARTFESSLAKVHKITKKVGQNRSAPPGSFNFTGKRLSLLVSVHMAFVEGMLIKQMRLFLGV